MTKKKPDIIVEDVTSSLRIVVKALSPFESGTDDTIAFVEGDSIRSIVARAMQKFKLTEPRVRLEFEVSLLEQNKSFGWFGQDMEIAKSSYSPFGALGVSMIEPTKAEILLQDDKGLYVQIFADYQKNTEENAEQ